MSKTKVVILCDDCGEVQGDKWGLPYCSNCGSEGLAKLVLPLAPPSNSPENNIPES